MTNEEAIESMNRWNDYVHGKDVEPMTIAEPCSDVISRQAVIDVVFESHKNFNNEFDQGFFVDKIRDLPSVTPMPKTGHWIPVSERLPEDCYAVLVWCPERKNIYCAYRKENQWWIFGAYFEKVRLDVIAWMPLPEPYKVEPQESEVKDADSN